ncbi:DUF3558 domain-containing protein [Streptomyces sp. NPDC091376]|uniref:DUF3558 domain-containing protein n=1 Tax=Streptomyces sp. NPDC091376 TaxID=3365994 RepID=UPI00382CB5DE
MAVAPAVFVKLPSPCKALTATTVDALVPEVKSKAGTSSTGGDPNNSSWCYWNGLKDLGVNGSTYRWLDVFFRRFGPQTGQAGGEQPARDTYRKEVSKIRATEGSRSLLVSPARGIGEEATVLSYNTTAGAVQFRHADIVVRTGNVVMTLRYNGAGYEGAPTPDSSALTKSALAAAREAVASVAKANEIGRSSAQETVTP